MSINVTSEIGKLKTVMLHKPGVELEHLVPEELERLLFDDIPYLETAQKEHAIFAGILQENGVEVTYLEDLTAEVLKQDQHLKETFVRQFIQESGSTAKKFSQQLYDLLMDIKDEKELVLKLMSGVGMKEIQSAVSSPLVDLVRTSSRFIMDPIPNLYFTRDPFATIGKGVSLNCMYSKTRRRETIFGQYILEYHPDFAGTPRYYQRDFPFSIEGGDILNLSRNVLAVGISQRTTPEAIEILAQNMFSDPTCEIDTVLALDIPSIRAYMHLDTVCTQVDYDKFTIHPGILGSLRIYKIRRNNTGKDTLHVTQLDSPLSEVLASCLEVDHVSMIHCGGKDRIAAEREQWNDGSNTLCIEPGKVVVYDRNYITNRVLEENGIQVLEMPSSELSRGRGGPRCMSMPLIREDM